MKYKIGDKIRVLRNATGTKGKDEFIGKIYEIKDTQGSRGSHGEAYGIGETYVVFEGEIELANTSSKILITTDGTKTLARLYEGNKVIKSAEAKRSPDDTFNFNTGAQLAFNRLVYGTDYHPAEAAFRKPIEKPEAVKLYCVKGFKPGEWLTKGKVYEANAKGKVKYDDGYQGNTKGYFISEKEPIVPNYLVPLVSRPAKVGEWVYMLRDIGGELKPETIHKCTGDGEFDGRWARHVSLNYLVLDGYQPEPEKPKYYSGKVVCVEKGYKSSTPLPDFTPGKVYEVKDGVITDDAGWHSNPIFKDIERLCISMGHKFIEYKE